MDIRHIDLNLLAVFEVLMRECNVTRAAERLRLSQPAVSAALGRLRDSIGDPLLVRTGRGMRPTPRAYQIIGSVSQALNAIQATLQQSSAFDPATANRAFTLMLTDIGEITYLPRLIARVQSEAPNVRLFVRRLVRPLLLDELSLGSVDLAVGHIERPHPLLCTGELFQQTFVCMLRRDHPRIGRKLTLNQFMSEWHLIVGHHTGESSAFRSRAGNVEQVLAKLGVERKVAMSVPYFLSVPTVIADTDLLCVVPRRFAEVHTAQGAVRVLPLPFECESFKVSQFWHKRFDQDEGSKYLRRLMREMFAENCNAVSKKAVRRRRRH